jgi:hypothetical protein
MFADSTCKAIHSAAMPPHNLRRSVRGLLSDQAFADITHSAYGICRDSVMRCLWRVPILDRLGRSRMQDCAVAVHHPKWQPGQAEMAADGGADRRSAKNAARPLNQSREAHPLGLSAPLPEGASRPRSLWPTSPTRGMTSGDPASRRQGVREWPA